jgi:hypothetical protein
MALYTFSNIRGLPGRYTFDLHPNLVLIPGHGGGRDGPTIADHPEQEAWMREHSGLRETWHLSWELPDAAEYVRFRALLGEEQG